MNNNVVSLIEVMKRKQRERAALRISNGEDPYLAHLFESMGTLRARILADHPGLTPEELDEHIGSY